jgi:lysophospholipase L1-like esterase
MMKKAVFLTVLGTLLATGPSLFVPSDPGLSSLIVACAGDSIMRPVPAHFRELAAGEGFDLEIHEWAQGGLNSETYQSFFSRNLPDWGKTRCDAILLQLGTNDAVPILDGGRTLEQFRNNMMKIIRQCRSFLTPAGKRCPIFLASVPLFCDRPEEAGKNRIVDTVINPVLMDLAKSEGVILVDQHLVLRNHPELYDPDCVHPNTDGEIALARNWLRALRAALLTY